MALWWAFFSPGSLFQLQAKKAAKLEKFKEKQQKKPTDAKESKAKETKAKPAKVEAAAKDVVVGELVKVKAGKNVESRTNSMSTQIRGLYYKT